MRSKTYCIVQETMGKKLFFIYIRLTFNLEVVYSNCIYISTSNKVCFFFFLSFGKEYQILKQVHKVSLGKKSKWENKIKFLKLAYPFKIFGEYNWSISSIVLFGGYWAVNCFLYFLNFAMETWMVEDFIPWWLRWILLEIMCYNNYIKKWV